MFYFKTKGNDNQSYKIMIFKEKNRKTEDDLSYSVYKTKYEVCYAEIDFFADKK